MNRPTCVVLLPVALLLAGCQQEEPAIISEPADPPMEQTTPPGIPEHLEPLVESARRDLAGRLGVEAAEIRLRDAGSVTWRDGSLGCPQPGYMYTQALVPGYRIRLEVDGTTYHYHGARNRDPMYCPPERVVEPAPDGAAER